jgi:hypothetical protein
MGNESYGHNQHTDFPGADSHKKIKSYYWEQIKKAKDDRNPYEEARERVRRQYMGDYSDQFREAGGDADAEAGTTQDTASLSLVFSTNKTVQPYLYYKNPTISARSSAYPGLAKCIEKFADYLHREQPYKSVTKDCVQFADLYGMGCIASEWDSVRGLPTRRAVPMKNIVVNPDATSDKRSIRWVAERFVENIRVLKSNPNIKHKDKLKPAGPRTDERDLKSTENHQQVVDMLDDVVKGWKIWIRNDSPGLVPEEDPKKQKGYPEEKIGTVNNRMIMIVDESPYIHMDVPWPHVFDHDEFPYTFLRFNSEEGSFWGFSDYTVTKGLQNYINWVWSFVLRKVRKSCTTKTLYNQTMSPDVIERLRSGKDLEMIPCNPEHMREVGALIQHIEFPDLKGELLHLLDRCKAFYDEIVGVTSYMRGGLPASGSRSATQAEIEDERAQNRLNEKLDLVEEFLSTLARKDVQIAAANIPQFDSYEVVDDVEIGYDPLEERLRIVDTSIESLPYPTESLKKGDMVPQNSPVFALLLEVGGVEVAQRGMVSFVEEQYAQHWIDTLSVEQIRREVYIEVEHGTTRKANKTQMIQERMALLQNLVPVFMQVGLPDKVALLINDYIKAHEVPGDSDLLIQPEELQHIEGATQRMAMAMQRNQALIKDGETGAGGNGAMSGAGEGAMSRLVGMGAKGLQRSATDEY